MFNLEEFQKIVSENAAPIDNILPHASKEDDRLLPIMKKNLQLMLIEGGS